MNTTSHTSTTSLHTAFPFAARLTWLITILMLVSGCVGLSGETLLALPPTSDLGPQTTANPQVADSPQATNTPQTTDGAHVIDISLLGFVIIGPSSTFEETRIGGLSAVAYNKSTGEFLFLTDDSRMRAPSHVYVADVNIADGGLANGDLLFKDVITLESPDSAPDVGLNSEGMVVTAQGTLIIASEGIRSESSPAVPTIAEFTGNGAYIRSFSLPPAYWPSQDGTHGMRRNRNLENLTLTPNGRYLFTATENPLVQDGPRPNFEHGAHVRILQFDLETGEPLNEYIYLVDPVATMPSVAGGDTMNGLVELVALDNDGTFLALERSYSEGKGVTSKLFELSTKNAANVSGLDALQWQAEDFALEASFTVSKRLLLDSTNLGIIPSNYEGMTMGPVLDDGRQTLLLVNDNNFSGWQPTLVVAFALTLGPDSALPQPAP